MLVLADERSVQAQTINIRPAKADDVTDIVSLVNTHALRGDLLPRSTESVYNTIDDWIVAEAEGEILGCVSLLPYTAKLVEVRSLAVQDQAKGLRIGTHLLRALIDEARRRRIPTLFALTRVAGFFERFGFTVTVKSLFPEKVWRDCQQCPLVDNCDETAVVLNLLLD